MTSSSVSYNNDPDVSNNQQQSMGHSVFEETPSQQSSVGTFLSNQFGRKNEDLKAMLDGTKDSSKLDAMKRIVGMLASGKDVSDLFPAVVKNVVSKNIEIKKLVYVYLVRYAEEQQDLALLSIATFQRGLKDPNQLIRASALRVLSSIRVAVIVPIMMLSLKEAVSDMSPYVRKTAANAIPKLYSMDPEQKEALIEIIEKLLHDKTTLVAGSTVIAFEEVCPERIDLIHKNYRKLCNMLIDIDEWGQVAVINMLVRYARTQFIDPNKNLLNGVAPTDAKFYPSSESEGSDSDEEEDKANTTKGYMMDPDHRLLLQSCQSLLQSRNSAVVMSVAKLYHHIAPASEVGVVVKALVRLLRSHREVQTIVLSNIVTLSLQRKGLFDSYMKSFFVHAGDPTHIKKLKLEILTNLATESNIPTILREFQTYVAGSDKDVVAASIQAIGRCASNIPEVADTCLAGLIRMLSNRDEHVVSESIIVVKKLLQTRHKDHSDVITHMAKLLDKVHVAMARASIIWLIGEYSDRVPKIAPDVLRKMAKTFATEEDIVKLQIMNLGAKLYITNSKQTRSLCQYVLQLAKYDQNYDIRDRARFLKFLLFPVAEAGNNLKKKAKKIFLVEKPAPILQSLFKDRGQYQLGSLSHMIDNKAAGYQELPEFPDEKPDSSVRNVEMEPVYGNQFLLTKEKSEGDGSKPFYSNSDDESSSEEESGEEDSDDEESDDGEEEGVKVTAKESEEEESSDEESGEESEFDEISEDSEEEEEETSTKEIEITKTTAVEGEEDSETESDDEESSSEEEDSESEAEQIQVAPVRKKKVEDKVKNIRPNQSSYDQLLDLDDFSAEPMTNGNASLLTPSLSSDMESLSLDPVSYSNLTSPNSVIKTKIYELLSKIKGQGLVVDYHFTRGSCAYSNSMIPIELNFKNRSRLEIKKIRVANKKLSSGCTMQEFPEIVSLEADGSLACSISVDMKDTMQPVQFDICTETSTFPVSIKVPVGELMRGVTLNETEFTSNQKKLTGMTESSLPCDIDQALLLNDQSLSDRIMEICYMNRSPFLNDTQDEKLYRFSANLVSSGLPVLLTVKTGLKSCVIVNCEKMSVGSLLAKAIKTALIVK